MASRLVAGLGPEFARSLSDVLAEDAAEVMRVPEAYLGCREKVPDTFCAPSA